MWVPVLRVVRKHEAWWNLRLVRRNGMGQNEGVEAGNGALIAEYELVRTDGLVLSPWDVVPESLLLHDEIVHEIAKTKRSASRPGSSTQDASNDLDHVVKRLPRNYRTVGVRVYNPTRPQWKMQLAWKTNCCSKPSKDS